jgi:pyruvate dehydrogenase complex dehydrogenase (E1) component
MKYQGEGGGVVVDGTGGSIKSMENLVNEFKAKGYDVSMVFTETSLDVALERNAARKERSLLDKIVEKNHEAVQGNKDGFKEMFGDRFMEVNTDNLSQKDAMPSKLS